MFKLIKIIFVTFLYSGMVSATVIDASTDVTLFIDNYSKGPENVPTMILSYNMFASQFGNNVNVEQYFKHGGSVAYVMNAKNITTGLSNIPADFKGQVNTIVMPSLRNLSEDLARPVRIKALEVARAIDMMVLIDPPKNLTLPQVIAWRDSATELVGQSRAAVYFPDLIVKNPVTHKNKTIGPSSVVAGIFAKVDSTDGVFTTPAGISNGAIYVEGLKTKLKENEWETLNSSTLNINPIVNLQNYGNVIYGGRTSGGSEELKYISVQRTINMINQSIIQSFAWTVFEPAGENVRRTVSRDVSNYLTQLYLRGALYGTSLETSYQVVCDSTNNSAEDDAKGIQHLKVKVALVRPGEFTEININLETLPKN